jgi:hypothetical protein
MKMPVVFNENPVFLCKFKSHEKRRSTDLLKRLLQLLAACMVISCISAFGQENTSVKINPGHNGAWFNPTTSGQGFLLDVMPETNLAFLAWFTYDLVQPAPSETATVGYPGHRWLTAQGPLKGNAANLNVYLTRGGLFDNSAAVRNIPDGTITLTFNDCTSGTVDYQLTSAGVSGSIPIIRAVSDNVALCESISRIQAQKLDRVETVSARQTAVDHPDWVSRTDSIAGKCEINPGHNGAWFNPVTSGQGFLLDVMPETSMAFLAWFTYDTTQPEQGRVAQIGDPGHRWLTAQGPLGGINTNLDVYLSRNGQFDDPAQVSNTPEGSITLTFDSCTSGTVNYQLNSAGVSGSIPISRAGTDNVALCRSLCGDVVVEDSRPQTRVHGQEGGIISTPDKQGNIARLTIPEGILAGSKDHVIEASPLDQATKLPTGHLAFAGMQWSSGPGPVIGSARLEILTSEADRYPELGAFHYEPESAAFYFLPLLISVDEGVVLEVPSVSQGTTGLAFITASEMEQWPPPASPVKARYLQQMAIKAKKIVESAAARESAPGNAVVAVASDEPGPVKPKADPFDFTDFWLPEFKAWFDNEIKPSLGAAIGGCYVAADFVRIGEDWLSALAMEGYDDHSELQSRISTLESAFEQFSNAAIQDIGEIDQLCALESDPCAQVSIMQELAVCAQALNLLGTDMSLIDLACANAPSVLSVAPKNRNICPGETIQFYAVVKNLKGDAIDVDQAELLWTSDLPQSLTINPESGEANAVAEGYVLVSASSEVCGFTLSGNASVEVNSAPDIGGSYSLTGSETVRGCLDPEDNGVYGGSGMATISMGPINAGSASASFSGKSDGPGFGHSFSGTVSCSGSLSGGGTYSESETSGNSSFSGSFSGRTIIINGSGQDVAGDTCSSKGWARATRK